MIPNPKDEGRLASLDALRPGAVLAREVRNRDGRLLFNAGSALDLEGIRQLKAWGVFQVQVRTRDAPDGPAPSPIQEMGLPPALAADPAFLLHQGRHRTPEDVLSRELLIALSDFQPGVKRIHETREVLEETLLRAHGLLDFRTSCFLLVDQTTSRFRMALCSPPSQQAAMEVAAGTLIASGVFAWALRALTPVPATGPDGSVLVLHAIASRDRVRGMFLAVLEDPDVPDLSLTLLSLVLNTCAGALQGVELFETIGEINRELSRNIKRLTDSQAELKSAYEQRRQAEETYRGLFENALEGMFQSTMEGGFIQANPAMARLFGYDSPAEFMSTITQAGTQLYTDPAQRRDLLARLMEHGVVHGFECLARRKDGSRVWVEVSARLVRDSHGGILCIEGMVQDINARKQAEDRRRQLEQADRLASLGTLVAGVAHEINNPCGVIMLNAPLLASAWADAAVRLDREAREDASMTLAGLPYARMSAEIPALFAEVQEAAERIKRIVADLKAFARQEATPVMEPVDLNEVVRTAIRLTRNKIKGATNRFSLSLQEGLAPVMGHFHRLEQVVINLVINACQALTSPDQALEVSTGLEPDTGRVLVVVRDQGMGMDQETLDHIQDPFFTTKRDSGGMGLGLAVSTGIAAEHRGTLRFESRPGQGSTATLALPALKEEARPGPGD